MESNSYEGIQDPNRNAAALWADGSSPQPLVAERVSEPEKKPLPRTPPERAALPLKDRVALVTGSSRGIGRAIADELMRQGANCAYNCVSSIDALQQLMFERHGRPGRSIAVQADVSEPDACKRLVERTMEELGRIDILVNNAGITRDRTLRKMTDEDWLKVINHDLNSVFYCTRLVLPHMIERGYGRIVNVCSIIGQTGNVGQANYAAAKAGMIGFTKSAAREVARHGITVNAVCPGFIATDMLGAVPEEAKQKVLSQIPLGRFGKSEEIAAMVRFLVTEGEWITGQQFNINGGMYM